MMSRWNALLSITLLLYPLASAADNVPQIPQNVSFKTLVVIPNEPLTIQGLPLPVSPQSSRGRGR